MLKQQNPYLYKMLLNKTILKHKTLYKNRRYSGIKEYNKGCPRENALSLKHIKL